MNIDQLAQKHGFSQDAVKHLVEAMQRGNGSQAQFNHPEFGGMGQWQNGMLMIGDAFNYQLKAKIDALCRDLSGVVKSDSFPAMKMPAMTSSQWWSDDLGNPSSSGQQNEARYAIFSDKKRVAIMKSGKLSIYDTKSHRITGVSQQQSNSVQQLVFTTTDGKTVTVDDFEPVK